MIQSEKTWSSSHQRTLDLNRLFISDINGGVAALLEM
jgi:hypothetical protein